MTRLDPIFPANVGTPIQPGLRPNLALPSLAIWIPAFAREIGEDPR